MKRIILLLLVACPFFVMAQSEPTKTPSEQYCMLMATSKVLSSKVNITVDFGQETKLFSFKDQRLKDEEGKVISFNSVVDALNYMSTQGWIFVNAYSNTLSSQSVLHYIMRRPINSQ